MIFFCVWEILFFTLLLQSRSIIKPAENSDNSGGTKEEKVVIMTKKYGLEIFSPKLRKTMSIRCSQCCWVFEKIIGLNGLTIFLATICKTVKLF